MASDVHFVGSIGLDSVDEVFQTCGSLLGPHLKRVPDGEPGGRRLWIGWQLPLLRASPYLQPVASERQGDVTFYPLKLATGVRLEDVHFGELGNAREARISYIDFCTARDKGILPRHVRFQVSLPTPLAVVGPFIVPEAHQVVLPAYEQAMLHEVDALTAAIPRRDLAIQWDVAIEMIMWDGRFQPIPGFPGMEAVFRDTFQRLAQRVSSEVDLGFHLCYGDLDGKHFVQPVDATKMVELANLIAESAKRPIAWMHMPVPVDRSDDAFSAPLRNLKLPAGTEHYLGLVHDEDGVEGTKKRMAAARKYIGAFGVATECGIARARTPERVRQILEVYSGAAKEGA
jgi:hypothetical protein